jgi:hypothetical protein
LLKDHKKGTPSSDPFLWYCNPGNLRSVLYSILRLFSGFASAACTHLKLTVIMATSSVIAPYA